MPTIIACPHCQQDVALPSRVEGALLCPHCDGEFLFAASANARPAPNGDVPFAPSTVEVSPDAVTDAQDNEAPIAQAAPISNDPGASAPPVAPLHHQLADEFDDEPAASPVQLSQPTSWPAQQDTIPQNQTPQNSAPHNPGQGLAIETDAPASPRSRAVANRSRRRKSPAGQLLGVVGGGVLGLAIGYYLLNYFGGPQFNFLNLQLPGINHQQPKDDEEQSSNSGTRSRDDDAGTTNKTASRDNGERDRSADSADQPPPRFFTPPVFSASDLQKALATASRQMECQDCNLTGTVTQRVFGGADNGNRVTIPCPTCAGNPRAHIGQDNYPALCDLARTVTWVNGQDPSARGIEEALRAFLLKVAKTAEMRGKLNQLAKDRLTPGYSQANANNSTDTTNGAGILLVGEITGHRQDGKYFLTQLNLHSADATPLGQITVASSAQAPGLLGESLLVAGAVLHNPRTALNNYGGNEAIIVWGGFPLVVR